MKKKSVCIAIVIIALLVFCIYVCREIGNTCKEWRETSIRAEDTHAEWARRKQKEKIKTIEQVDILRDLLGKKTGGNENVEKMEN